MKSLRNAVSAFLALVLAACAQTGAPVASKGPPPLDRAAALRAIRDAGHGLDSAVQVQPLRDAAIDGYAQQSRDAETRNDYKAAAAAMDKALHLAPDAPDLLQSRAEIDIALGDFAQAEKDAMKSFSLGPKVGSICAKNWQTVVEARTGMGDAASAQQATQRVKECRVKPIQRM